MEEEDSKRTEELATIEKIRWLGNRLVPGLKLTVDLPELHPNNKCPMLDIQVWAELRGNHQVIRHTFFEKETASPLVFNASSAYGWKAKITTLAEELRRRLTNMDKLHNEEEMEAVVGKFLQKLTDSGYKNSHRKEIIRSGCINFCRRQIEDRTGGKKLYRTETQMKEARKTKKHSN